MIIMKKMKMILATMICLFATLTVNAQDKAAPADYFVGTWNVLVEGTPKGDSNMKLFVERVDGKLTGKVIGDGKTEDVEFTRVEEKEKAITAYFTGGGYNVYIYLEKKDDNSVTGSLMDMFDAKGTRAVVAVTK